MTWADGLLAAWLAATGALAAGVVLLGLIRRLLLRSGVSHAPQSSLRWVSVILPIKGFGPNSETALRSVLEQDYPSYEVILVIEGATDPASALVDELAGVYGHSRKVVAGQAVACAQKNHNLIAGAAAASPQSEVLVFCDSSNVAGSEWLRGLVAPIFSGEADATTTFRAFDPTPRNAAGVAQAVYSAFVGLLIAVNPMPWGGASAIGRRVFEGLRVSETWACSVVDDLVLGNILREAGINIRYLPELAMRSPTLNQSLKGLLDYLDRQILFPKFTNPGIWGFGLFFQMNVTTATLVSLVLVIVGAPVLGLTWVPLWASMSFLGLSVTLAAILRTTNPYGIPFVPWVLGYFAAVGAAGFIFVRSLFRDYVEWGETRYTATTGGVVTAVQRPRP